MCGPFPACFLDENATMTRTRTLLLGLAVCAALSLLPNLANACDGYGPNGWLDARAFGASGSLYGLGYVSVPPYYSLHPPVYYGERYYRSYGESPFARADYSSRPQRIQAQVIINPFMEQSAPAPPAASKAAEPTAKSDQVTATTPQLIVNPYYLPEAKVATR
jgi:hypothetical protein